NSNTPKDVPDHTVVPDVSPFVALLTDLVVAESNGGPTVSTGRRGWWHEEAIMEGRRDLEVGEAQ
ncbi:MAG: hypothetical protein TREMPRED_002409, partial [Tremellales sp. Tagirdzhanova-0007]